MYKSKVKNANQKLLKFKYIIADLVNEMAAIADTTNYSME
jgi:hypothetical protein